MFEKMKEKKAKSLEEHNKALSEWGINTEEKPETHLSNTDNDSSKDYGKTLEALGVDLDEEAASSKYWNEDVFDYQKEDIEAREQQVYEENPLSPEKYQVFKFLALFLGIFGAHRFFLKRYVSAVVMILLGILSLGLISVIWVIIDLAKITTGNFKDKDGHKIKVYSDGLIIGIIIYGILLVALCLNAVVITSQFYHGERTLASRGAFVVPEEKIYALKQPIDIIDIYEDDEERIETLEGTLVIKNVEVVMGDEPLLKVDYTAQKKNSYFRFDVNLANFDGSLKKSNILKAADENYYSSQSYQDDYEIFRNSLIGTTADFTQYYEFSSVNEHVALVIGENVAKDYTAYIDLTPYVKNGTLDLNGTKNKFNTTQKPEVIPQGEEGIVEGIGIKVMSLKSDYVDIPYYKGTYERSTAMIAEIQVTNYRIEPIDFSDIQREFILADENSGKDDLMGNGQIINDPLFEFNNEGIIEPEGSKIITIAFKKIVYEDEGDLKNYIVYNPKDDEFENLTKFKLEFKFEPRQNIVKFNPEDYNLPPKGETPK